MSLTDGMYVYLLLHCHQRCFQHVENDKFTRDRGKIGALENIYTGNYFLLHVKKDFDRL